MRKLKVFISSVQSEFAEERQMVFDYLIQDALDGEYRMGTSDRSHKASIEAMQKQEEALFGTEGIRKSRLAELTSDEIANVYASLSEERKAQMVSGVTELYGTPERKMQTDIKYLADQMRNNENALPVIEKGGFFK